MGEFGSEQLVIQNQVERFPLRVPGDDLPALLPSDDGPSRRGRETLEDQRSGPSSTWW